MQRPEVMSEAVKAAIQRYASNRAADEHEKCMIVIEIMQALTWDGLCGCYGFMRAGMYHGIELDGHIHT